MTKLPIPVCHTYFGPWHDEARLFAVATRRDYAVQVVVELDLLEALHVFAYPVELCEEDDQILECEEEESWLQVEGA